MLSRDRTAKLCLFLEKRIFSSLFYIAGIASSNYTKTIIRHPRSLTHEESPHSRGIRQLFMQTLLSFVFKPALGVIYPIHHLI